jgi:GDPmannose 4,6-dehydratase
VSAFAVVNILEAIHLASPRTKFFQASSSEMFGNAQSSPQHENSSFRPRNVYGSAKVFAHYLTQNYRDHRDLFAASGILYNHESPLRGDEFVTRKITKAVAKVKLGITDRLSVGNLSAKRDWGYAPEYVEAMRLILNHEQPDTFVISSGTATTVREFILSAFNSIDVELEFEGEGLSEVGLEKKSGQILVSIDKQFYREPEPITLVGDPGKANRALNWKARTSVSEIAKIMVESELQTMRQI